MTRQSVKKQRDRRAKFIGIVLSIGLLILCYRIYYYQTVWGEEFSVFAVAQQTREHHRTVSRAIQPARGGIMDRHMQPIASSIPVFEIFMDVNLLHAARNRNALGVTHFEETINALHRQLGIPSADLLEYFRTNPDGSLTRPTSHRILAREVEASIALYLRDNYTHIHATATSLRWYHDPFFAPQVVGFMRGDASWGLEALYNQEMTGAPGRVIFAHGEQEEIPVRDGYTLITTLDSDIQRIAQSIVDQTFIDITSDFVGMIVMDPFTGEILAMAQAPTFSITEPFNPNYITDRQLRNNWDLLDETQRTVEMQRLWRNFHTHHSYEPGSIFKPFVIAAAIEEGLISPNQHFLCSGVRPVFDQEIHCWTIHGSLTLTEAIAQSCNVAMTYIMDRLGRPDFYRYRGYFGFGERTGIDLPFETCVSHPALMYTYAALMPVQRATSSIGQGFNATSLQSITGYAALINGGNLIQPFIVSQVVDAFGNVVQETQPTVVRRVISPQTSDFMRRQMQYVVSADNGTGFRTRIPGHAIGGKTGTGQQGVRAHNINTLTYISYTPVENPEFLVLMVVDQVYHGTYGGAGLVVTPRVRQFFEELIAIRGLQPSDGPYALDYWQNHVMASETMPDYSGQRLADAVRDLSHRSGSGYQVVGTGTIVSHTIPVPGVQMPQTSTVFFHMEPDTRIEGQMSFVPDLVGLTVDQAQIVLREVGLPAVLLDSLITQANFNIDEARTLGGLTDEELEYGGYPSDSPTAPESIPDIIYQQFPAPGTELERGTLVMLRAR